VKVKVPEGAYDGMILRFRGSGNEGMSGMESGDLFVELEVEPHEHFERRGYDIYTTEEISVYSAVLGDTLEVKTVSEKVKLKIPQGTQSGTVFMLKGKGAPVIGREGERGDQYVRVNVEIPKKLSRNERKMWEQLKEL